MGFKLSKNDEPTREPAIQTEKALYCPFFSLWSVLSLCVCLCVYGQRQLKVAGKRGEKRKGKKENIKNVCIHSYSRLEDLTFVSVALYNRQEGKRVRERISSFWFFSTRPRTAIVVGPLHHFLGVWHHISFLIFWLLLLMSSHSIEIGIKKAPVQRRINISNRNMAWGEVRVLLSLIRPYTTTIALYLNAGISGPVTNGSRSASDVERTCRHKRWFVHSTPSISFSFFFCLDTYGTLFMGSTVFIYI